MGNLRSVARAFERCGAAVSIVAEPKEVVTGGVTGGAGGARALVFPGQGAIADCMARLKATGFDALIRDWVAADRPFFGICLGLQALFEHSEEGDTRGLGIFPGRIKRFRFDAESTAGAAAGAATTAAGARPRSPLKIPHMGWNTAVFRAGAPLTDGVRAGGESFYFVHSYYLDGAPDALVWCETEYGRRFTSGVRAGNCFATQFHPEKSQSAGLRLYANFLRRAAGAG
jgi:glutamine amidotransferase